MTVPERQRPRVCIVSHRFGGFDGVSVEAAKWIDALESLGWNVTRAAGHIEGEPRQGDEIVGGMWSTNFGDPPPPPDARHIRALCADADLVVLDNAATLWTLPHAAAVWEAEIRAAGVPAIVRHHDPPWQTPHTPTRDEHLLPLRDPSMLHVTINSLTRDQFAARWPYLVDADALTVVHNTVDVVGARGGDRRGTRERLGIAEAELLVVQPARNIARKRTRMGLAVAEALDRPGRRAHYWLTDPSGPIGNHQCDGPPRVPIHRGFSDCSADLYAAADLVVLPSSWEGWGLPVLEAAAAGKPVAAGPYPVLSEIRALGVTVFDPSDISSIRALLDDPDALRSMAARNVTAASAHSTATLPDVLSDLIDAARALKRALRPEEPCAVAAATSELLIPNTYQQEI